MNVLKKCNKNKKGSPTISRTNSVLYVVRVMSTTENLPDNQSCWLGMAKPCKNCELSLYKQGIKKIKYTNIIDGKQVLVEMKIIL